MNTAVRGSFEEREYFTLAGYRAILERARSLRYRITTFRDFVTSGSEPVLLLRHDLDHSLRAAAVMAEEERDVGVRATYFVQVSCDFYNLLSRESRSILQELAAQGHEIGLYYDARRYVGARGHQRFAFDIEILEDVAETRVVSAAEYMPLDGVDMDVRRWIDNEARDARFTEEPFSCISDALMQWRQCAPHDLLDQGRSFQLSIHPMNWVAHFASLEEALNHVQDDEQRELGASYAAVRAYYSRLLRDREHLDPGCRARIAGVPALV